MTPSDDVAVEPASGWVLVAAGLALGLVLIAAGAFALRATTPAQAADVSPAELDRKALLDLVTQDPDNLAARLELAHDYFDASDYDLALEHYLVVLEARPNHGRALARAGWIAFEGGDNATAERLVTESLAVNPDDPEALWFLGHVRLYGLRDPQAAAVPLETLLERDDLSDGFRVQVEVLLDRARSGRI